MKLKKTDFPPRATTLYAEYSGTTILAPGQILRFSGLGDSDVYNISSPFLADGRTVLLGRVERREAWARSVVMFFQEQDGCWSPVEGAPVLKLEDGFAARVGGEIVLGGVEVWPRPTRRYPDGVDYRTSFFRGSDLASLRRFTAGPDRMKDIRLVELASGKIGVMTRPQGWIGGRGRIGYLELNSLDELTPERIMEARLIKDQFQVRDWGGANQLHLLPDGRLGVLGHIARRDGAGHLHYCAMTFTYDPATHTATPLKLLATRRDFPSGAAKNIDLEDIVFSGGLVRHGDGTATLYAGLNDAEAGSILVVDPFETTF